MKTIQIERFGPPDVMKLNERPVPEPGEGQLLVKLEAIGVNFIDTYHRTGLYPVDLPYIPGLEGAGVVEKCGSLSDFQVGDRVAFANVAGAYAEYIVLPAKKTVLLPENIDYRHAAASMLQGMTAHYLATSTYSIKKGDWCLIHAAAGGVGLLLVQVAKNCGAKIVATVSTEEKAQLARDAGADHVILYSEHDFENEVKRITDGHGVHVVYDSVGKATFAKSLNCLAPLGYMVLFGQSSGKVEKCDPSLLAAKGSLFLTRPSLFHYIADRKSFVKRATDVMNWILSGQLSIRIGHTYPLALAAESHKDLEGRKTTGKILLLP